MSSLPRRSWATRITRAVAALVALLWLVSLTAVLLWERRDDARPAAAIVVLGAAQYDGRPSPVLRARLDHALGLWRRRLAPRVIVTGGLGDGDTTSEGAVGRRYLLKHDVPDAAILVEGRGRTTDESLAAVAALMDRSASHEVILVSDPFHMLRLSILADRYGLHAHTSPTRTSPISGNPAVSLRYTVSESFKVPVVLLSGFGTAESASRAPPEKEGAARR